MDLFRNSKLYTPITDKDDSEGSITSSCRVNTTGRSKILQYSIVVLAVNSTCIVVLLIGLSVSLFAYRGTLLSQCHPDQASLIKQTSEPSPFIDQYNFALQRVFQNNTLFSDDILRQRPNDAVDAAWEDLSRITAMTVDANKVKALGKDPAMLVHLPNNSNQFPVMPSVSHQLHCMNYLRRGLEIPYYHGNKTLTKMYWEHVYHCLHLITQSITCHAEADPIFWRWVEGQEHPVPDFSGDRKCRDFQGFKSDLEGKGYDVHNVWLLQREGGEFEVPQEPGFLELENEDDHSAEHQH
ncbi:hypothetical protein V8C35DRAFT_327399 [Trichoderma chlorosporum]